MIASKHAERVDKDIEYYRTQSSRCAYWQRFLSILLLGLASITPILIALATIWRSTSWGDTLQIASILAAGAIAFVEGISRIFAFDKRWASNYLAIWALRTARSDYKIKRIGLIGEDWQRVFKVYVNRYFDIIGKENSEFFTLVQPVDTISAKTA